MCSASRLVSAMIETLDKTIILLAPGVEVPVIRR